MQAITTPTTADNYSGAERLETHLKGDWNLNCRGHGELCSDGELRPAPICIEGKAVNLDRLCSEIATCGGYEQVTNLSMWSSISERLGFGESCGGSVKVVYTKYLKGVNYGKGILKSDLLHKGVDCHIAKAVGDSSVGMVTANCDITGSSSTISLDSSVCHEDSNFETPSKRRRLSYLNSSSSHSDYDLPTTFGNNDIADMIKWLRRVAVCPGDPRKGRGPRGSRQNEAWVEESEIMLIKVRCILWGRKELIYYGGLTSNMAKQRIPPSLYYKDTRKPNANTLEKLRANHTRAIKCGLHVPDAMDTGPEGAHGTSGKVYASGIGQSVGPGLQLSAEYLKSMNEALSIGYLLNSNTTRKRIPIGVHFQALVPEWTGKPNEVLVSSCGEHIRKPFTGIRVWPLLGNVSACEISRVGKGPPSQCECAEPMSIECVKLHIVEKRERLKKEIGIAFYSWGFHDMGESVSRHWKEMEQHVFNMTVRLNPSSLGKNFWDELPAALPVKTMKELVSYYFNVFVVRRRAIENRVMPDSIDSDDDEREVPTSESYNLFGDDAPLDYGKSTGRLSQLVSHHESTGTLSTNVVHQIP
ncbi:hypothetical protein KP509_04G028400 [Ceratopteris richardii]|nr:hypothetical protein KP509_04G028400 [Ceratopteris richardii]KAH7438725.1 hypothetical protein KP509_04G028400 [Ceratopteris richardii]